MSENIKSRTFLMDFKELDFKELEIHRYSLLDIPIFIVGHPDIHCWTSINEFIEGPSMNMVHQ